MSLSESSFIIKNDGTLWGCGWNEYNQLGLGDKVDRTTFTQITTNVNNIKSICYSNSYTLMLKNDGTLWECGADAFSLGNTIEVSTFTIIGINTNDIKSIYCGDQHTIILKNDGTLWGGGDNSYGQLGLGDKVNRTTFTQITTNVDNIKSIYCGGPHTFILKNDGTLWGCGHNQYGQLGLGDTNNRYTFTQITSNTDNIKSICCGYEYTLILKNDSTLWGCGNNQYGQLGLGDTNNRKTFMQIINNVDNIKLVYCSNINTFILKNDNTLWGCGWNYYGQLGLGDAKNRNTFTQIANDINSVYCGNRHTLILKNNGELWGCGYNKYGQLGLGDTNDRKTFMQITTNVNGIKCFANDYSIPSTTKIYDSKIGYTETLDTNNFRNIPISSIETLKVLYSKPINTILNCVISFDKKQTWKTFNGTNWIEISDTTPENMIINCMEIEMLNSLDKKKLIAGGFTGDLDFKIAMKTNNVNKTPLITKIYIVYK